MNPSFLRKNVSAATLSSPPSREPADPLSADLYRLMVEQAPVGMCVVQHGRARFLNPQLARMFGYALDEMRDGLDPLHMTAAEDRPRVEKPVRLGLADPMDPTDPADPACDVRCVRKDGSVFSARIWSRPIELEGAPARLTTMHDVSEIRDVAQAAQRRAALLAQTEELARTGSSEYDVATGRVTQSTGMFRIFGEPASTMQVDAEWLMKRVPASEELFVRTILEGVRPDAPCEFEHRIVHADGGLRTVLHRAIAEVDAEGRTTRVIGLLQDITAQRQAEQQRDLLAHSDTVTHLPNRHALLDRLDDAARHALREGRSIALLALEIDQLRIVSDSFGYAAGDCLLAAVAERLQAAVASQHLLAHLGSGRYAVLMSGRADIDEASAVAAAIDLVGVFDAPFLIEDTEIAIHGAAGVTLCPRDADGADALLHQAQAAVPRGREQGGSRVGVYTADAHGRAATRLTMEAALRRALECGEFELQYQPQMDLATGALVGVEALLRWNDPQRGNVPPDEFIPLAEETGLILPIGDWVLRNACAQNLAWQRAGLAPIRMAVNLSVRQLEQPDLARRIHAVLIQTGLSPHHLGVEVTESLLVIDAALVARTLGELRALGVEISLDDFGTGYSNLGTLRTLPIDVVKVDRSLVHDVTAAPQDVSMTRAVINMAHALNMKVLAEGVETEGQLALLIANRCDQMQGYFFSAPVGAEAVAELLRERRALPAHLLQRRQHQRTLLLVDDEDNILAALKRLLRRDGYHVITANSGAQGLQRLAEHKVDVIVSDQRMPGMTGVEFLSQAKELYPDTVRMALSGYTELQSITDAINEGAIYKFLTKPWDDERLRGHIADAFKQKELVDENRRLGMQVQTANHELAEVNQRLQSLLDRQRELIGREEGSLDMAHEMLFCIPAPMIGIDADGMVAFVNADAQALFADAPALLGRPAPEVLPAALVALWRRHEEDRHDDEHDHGDGGGGGEGEGSAPRVVEFDGCRYRAVCRQLGRTENLRGKLLLLTPLETP